MISLKKSLEHVNKFRTIYILALFTLCMVIRIFVPFFAIIGFAVAAMGIIYETDIKGLYYIAYAYNFRFIMRFKSDDIYLFVLLIGVWLVMMAIKYIKDKKFKDRQFFIPLILISILILYVMIPRRMLISDVVNASKVAIVVVSIYLCYVYKEELNLKNLLFVFIASILMASGVSLFRSIIPQLDNLIRVYVTYGGKYRFMGLDRDPNFYAVSVLVSLATLCIFNLKRDVKWYLFYPLLLTLTVCGFSTISKSFLLVFCLMFAIYVLAEILTHKKRSLMAVGFSLVAVLIAGAICNTRIALMLDRFDFKESTQNTVVEQPVEDESIVADQELPDTSLNKFTTGRFNIWMSYLKYFKENPVKFIFGSGLGETTLDRPSHNTLIQGVYGVGVLGVLYIIAIVLLLIIKEFKKRFKWYELLPLFTFVCLAIALDFFVSTSMILFLGLGIFIINYNYNNNRPDNNLSNIILTKNKERVINEEGTIN